MDSLVTGDDLLDFERRHVLPAAADRVVFAINEKEEPFVIEAPEVAAMVPQSAAASAA